MKTKAQALLSFLEKNGEEIYWKTFVEYMTFFVSWRILIMLFFVFSSKRDAAFHCKAFVNSNAD